MIAHLTAGLRALFDAFWAERIDYYAMHPCTVVVQHDDGTLDVRAEARTDGRTSPLRDLSHVPIDIGLPGATVNVAKGSRVLIGFRGGDPTQRYAALTGPANVVSIAWESGDEFKCLAKKHTFDENGRGAARLADLVAIGGGLPLPQKYTPCFIQLVTAVGPPPAVAPVVPPPAAVTPGMTFQALIQFGPKPLVGAITTSKSSHKV